MNDLSKGSAERAAERAGAGPPAREDAGNRVAVGEDGDGQRVDNFLQKLLKGVPKSHIYRIVRSGEVRVNRRRVRPDTRLVAGDLVRLPPIRTAAPARTTRAAAAWPVALPPILYEDGALLALDKPAGLAVHGGSGVSSGAIERLRQARPEARLLELVHRLDRDTSGVLLIAKKRAALVDLHAQLREGRVDKRYFVLVRGRWRDAVRRVDLALETYVTRDGERRTRVERAGRTARTIFRRVKAWPEHEPPLALLEAELETGRTHQVRVHLTHLGYPLAGDDKYGDFAWNKALAREGLKRMFLHAHRLSFAHPDDGRAIAIESPLAADLAAFVARLDAGDGKRADG